MGKLSDRSLNNGGRVDAVSKLMGGMGFRGNSVATVVGGQNEWVVVGAGAIGHTAYTTTVPVTINPYFTVNEVAAHLQRLTFSGGISPTYVNVRFGVTVLIPGGGTISNIEYRLRRTDADLVTSTVETASVSASVLDFNFSAEFSSVAPIETDDQFFIEIRNITANQNIRVVNAHIAISQ